MNDKERLEEIQSRVWKDKGTYAMGDNKSREGYIYTLSDYDYEWLIKQAEKAEYYEMKYENTGAIFNRRHMLDKIERYENAIKECVERMNEGGAGTRSFVYEKLKEVMGGTE